MSNPSIPAEAVEAAAKTFYGAAWDDCSPEDLEYALGQMRETIEAAAPYIRAQALDDAKDALNPGGSYVLQNIAKWLSERAATERTTL